MANDDCAGKHRPIPPLGLLDNGAHSKSVLGAIAPFSQHTWALPKQYRIPASRLGEAVSLNFRPSFLPGTRTHAHIQTQTHSAAAGPSPPQAALD